MSPPALPHDYFESATRFSEFPRDYFVCQTHVRASPHHYFVLSSQGNPAVCVAEKHILFGFPPASLAHADQPNEQTDDSGCGISGRTSYLSHSHSNYLWLATNDEMELVHIERNEFLPAK